MHKYTQKLPHHLLSCFIPVSKIHTRIMRLTSTNFNIYLPRYRTGWSNFCTLVGHFSKLFEFADFSRLKTPIFVPKVMAFSKKKKKKSSLGIGLNPRLSSISSPCLVIQGCRCLRSTRLVQNCSAGL